MEEQTRWALKAFRFISIHRSGDLKKGDTEDQHSG